MHDAQGNLGVARALDHLSANGEVEGAIDNLGDGEGANVGEGEGDGIAVPTDLQQELTGWVPGDDKYGFQVRFTMGSSSGRAEDLTQNPLLLWREHVSYGRNDFAHRFSPNNPTIKPAGGIPFFSDQAVVSGNRVSFPAVTDTHWFPVDSAVLADFGENSEHGDLPAILQCSQTYQYTMDGSTWTNFAGPFTIRRTLTGQQGGRNWFWTNKRGIHMSIEQYKGP